MARARRGRGEGGVYQRGDGIWTGSVSLGYDEHGKRLRKVVYGSTKGEVQEKLRNVQGQAADGAMPLSRNTRQTVGEYLNWWLDTVAKMSTGETTLERYKSHAAKIKSVLGGVALSKLTHNHIEDWLARMARDGESASERRKSHAMLRLALKPAIKRKYIIVNVAYNVRLTAVPKHEIHPLSAEQARQLLKTAAERPYGALALLAVDSGCRQGELFALQWRDFDEGGACVHVRRNLVEFKGRLSLKEPKTKSGSRRIDLTPATVAALSRHREAVAARLKHAPAHDAPIFADADGGYLRKSNYHRRHYKPLLKAAGVPDVRFHDLRHSCATLLLNAGVDVKTVSERLGHAQINITLETYVHTDAGSQKRAVAALGSLLSEPGKTTGKPKARKGKAG